MSETKDKHLEKLDTELNAALTANKNQDKFMIQIQFKADDPAVTNCLTNAGLYSMTTTRADSVTLVKTRADKGQVIILAFTEAVERVRLLGVERTSLFDSILGCLLAAFVFLVLFTPLFKHH